MLTFTLLYLNVCLSVPVLLVMFGDLFVEVLWGVGDEAVF